MPAQTDATVHRVAESPAARDGAEYRTEERRRADNRDQAEAAQGIFIRVGVRLDRVEEDLKSWEQSYGGVRRTYGRRRPSHRENQGRKALTIPSQTVHRSILKTQNKSWGWMASQRDGQERVARCDEHQSTMTPGNAAGSLSDVPDGSWHRGWAHLRRCHQNHMQQCVSHLRHSHEGDELDNKRGRNKVPKLTIKRKSDAAQQMDNFDHGLNLVHDRTAPRTIRRMP